MRFSGLFFFLALKRSIYKTISNFVSNELPIEKNPSNNITELLLLTFPGNITRKNMEGEDNRFSAQTQDPESSIQNMAKKQLLAFLEDPTKTDLQKIERIRENEHMFANTNDTFFSSMFQGIRGYHIAEGMGGFNDCYGFIDLVL
jgi:hypothetical protein